MNTTLKQKTDIQKYIDICHDEGFVYRIDPPKNWDNYKSIKWIMKEHKDRNSVILDAGGIPESAFLPTLERLGYKKLIALDLCNPDPPLLSGNITFARGDITKTPYEDQYFDVVASLSVIEHGVDVELFFKEMARITKPGASVIVSTDYWQHKINNHDGRQAYGVPVYIFDQKAVEDAILIANKYGFEITSKVDYDCEEKTIFWMGFSYTFIVLCFRKITP